VVAVALVAAITVIIASGGSPPSQAAVAAAATSQLADDGGNSTGPSVAPGPGVSASMQATRSPAAKKSGSSSQHKQSAPAPSASSAQSTPAQSAPAQASSASPPSSPPATTAPPTKPAAGVLRVSPGLLTITSINNKPDQGTVTITAVGGPVSDLSVSVPQAAGHLLVSPVPGSLGSGKQTQLLVTGWSKHSFTATITLSPGNVVITIMVVAAT
jgi:hypothetical protein